MIHPLFGNFSLTLYLLATLPFFLDCAPFYTLYAVGQMVPATVGYANWNTMRLWGRRVYRDHYQPAAP